MLYARMVSALNILSRPAVACGQAGIRPFARRMSNVEVERKFVPSTSFHQYIKSLEGVQNHGSTSPKFRWSGESVTCISDTYYDLNENLARKGIWIRRRHKSAMNDNPQFDNSSPPCCWDAKERLGGNYVNSKFVEFEGRDQVQLLLSKHFPKMELEDLEVYASLQTIRSSWVVRFCTTKTHHLPPPYEIAGQLSVVLDRVTNGEDDVGASCQPFHHEVGEVELTIDAKGLSDIGSSPDTKDTLVQRVDDYIRAFMKYYPDLFSNLKPVGKLSAYFQWKKQLGY